MENKWTKISSERKEYHGVDDLDVWEHKGRWAFIMIQEIKYKTVPNKFRVYIKDQSIKKGYPPYYLDKKKTVKKYKTAKKLALSYMKTH